MNQSPCATHELQKAAHAEQIPEYAVSEQIVLAGQPQPEDWPALAERGFETVLNIRSDSVRAAIEGQNAEAAGLTYIHLPLPAYELEADHLATFNEIITQTGPGKLYLHCRTASRTALLWMLKRIVYDGWSPAQVEAELFAAGYEEDDMETFRFCTEDYFDRTAVPELALQI